MTDLRVVADSDPDTSTQAYRDWAGLVVPEGLVVRSGYVPIHDVVCYATFGHELRPADVERAYRRQLELGAAQAWPPPIGYWRPDDRFVLTDGRHRYVAALMLGHQYLFVAWLAPGDEP